MQHFGSVTGSYAALVFFAALFGLVAVASARALMRAAVGASPRTAGAVAAVILVGPLVLLYATSLNGFYTAEIAGESLKLRYLIPGAGAEMPLHTIVRIEPVPAFKGRWRLQVIDASGGTYESATSDRAVAARGSEWLKQEVETRRGR